MKTVSITFVGESSDLVAKTFYHWVVDGGLEDQIIQELDRLLKTENIEVDGIIDINNETLDIAMESSLSSA